jgi:flagellar basal-body rod modification protein FlgD
MGTVTGIWNHAADGALAGVTAMDSSTSGANGGSSNNSATISANDFLSLLVTEMQNQDPTADTDPNEYINQLVNVNSLEQLISINQTLSSETGGTGNTTGTPGASGSSGGSEVVSAVGSALPSGSVSEGNAASGVKASANHSIPQNSGALHAPGNLSIPNTNPAAQRVAQSLGGH